MIIDIYNSWLPIECPKCGYSFEITLRDTRLEERCYCHNCKVSIQLIDHNSSAYTGTTQINNALNSLEKTLNNLFK